MQFACPEQALWVAPLMEVRSFAEVEKNLTIDEEHFAFAEQKGKFYGLKKFLKYGNVYIFDNHNHALFFWYQHYLQTKKVCKVVHIDQHSDMWENQYSLPDEVLEADCSGEVFQFVQRYCNVGNFLQPALKSGLVSEVVQVITPPALRATSSFAELGTGSDREENYVLDMDLDFFAPEMGVSFLDCLLKLRELMDGAECMTIATSPYFLEQGRAVEMVKKLMQEV